MCTLVSMQWLVSSTTPEVACPPFIVQKQKVMSCMVTQSTLLSQCVFTCHTQSWLLVCCNLVFHSIIHTNQSSPSTPLHLALLSYLNQTCHRVFLHTKDIVIAMQEEDINMMLPMSSSAKVVKRIPNEISSSNASNCMCWSPRIPVGGDTSGEL